MQEVVFLNDVTIRDLERGLLLDVVDRDQVVVELAVHVALDAELLKRRVVLGHAKHGRRAGGKGGLDRVPHSVLLPLRERHPQRLLRRTGALDDASRLGEDLRGNTCQKLPARLPKLRE